MAFNINEFISHFDSHAGFARTSKFEVRINLPPALLGGGSTRELSLQCEAAELPGYTINTVEQKIFGPPTYMAGTSAYGDISLSFICAGDLWEKKLFDAWMELMVPKSTYLVNYKEDYQTTVSIHQYSDYMRGAQAPDSSNALQDAISGKVSKYVNGLMRSSLPKVSNALTTLQNNDILKRLEKVATPPTDAFKASEIYSCKLINAFPITLNAMPLNWGNDDIHRLTVVLKYDKWISTSDPLEVNQAPTKPIPGTDGAGQKNFKGTIIGGLIGGVQNSLLGGFINTSSKRGKI